MSSFMVKNYGDVIYWFGPAGTLERNCLLSSVPNLNIVSPFLCLNTHVSVIEDSDAQKWFSCEPEQAGSQALKVLSYLKFTNNCDRLSRQQITRDRVVLK